MNNPISITRRRMLIGTAGAAVSSAALAEPIAAAAQSAEPSAELHALCAEYERAAIAQIAAEREERAARDTLDKAVRAAGLRVKMTGRGRPHEYWDLSTYWPESTRREINKRFDQAIAAAERRQASQDPLRNALPTPEQLRAERIEVLTNARPAFAAFNRIRRKSGWDATIDRDTEARDAYQGAREALIAYHVATLAEVQLIAATLLRTAEATQRWYEMPARQLFEALAGMEAQS